MQGTPKKFLRFWFPVILYSGMIFYVSSLPNVRVPGGLSFLDKILHIIEYIPFGFLMVRALIHTNVIWTKKNAFYLAVVFSLFYGITDEIHQLFVVGRNATLGDVMVEAVGGGVGTLIYLLLRNLRIKELNIAGKE